VDVEGRVWCTAGDGVRVHDASGALLETVAVPQGPANCAFGGEDRSTLFITARTGVYKVACNTTGFMQPAPSVPAE
jgi:gluconolactonase